MPDIDKIKLPSGNVYNIKDSVARQAIAGGMSKIIAWNGASTPVVASIPAGVVVTYNGRRLVILSLICPISVILHTRIMLRQVLPQSLSLAVLPTRFLDRMQPLPRL